MYFWSLIVKENLIHFFFFFLFLTRKCMNDIPYSLQMHNPSNINRCYPYQHIFVDVQISSTTQANANPYQHLRMYTNFQNSTFCICLYLFIYLCLSLPIYRLIYFFIHLSTSICVYLSISPSASIQLYQATRTYVDILLDVLRISIHLSIYLPVYRFISAGL